MRFNFNIIIGSVIVAGSIAACSKSTIADPWQNETESDRISFGLRSVSSKAMLDGDALRTDGSKLKVFDMLTDFEGKIDGQVVNGQYTYIDGETIVYNASAYASDPVWPYEDEAAVYPWTKTGRHQFHGYLLHDAAMNCSAEDFFGEEFSYSGGTLSIPSTTMDASSRQFDFLYSDVTEVDAAAKTSSDVRLSLQHLFTAVALTIENNSDDDVTVSSVSINGINNTKSATVAWDGAAQVTYVGESATSFIPSLPTSGVALSKGDKYDLLRGAEFDGDRFFLLWPQTQSEARGGAITVKYTIAGDWVNPDDESEGLASHEKTIDFSEVEALYSGGWAPGRRNRIGLQFKGKSIAIRLTVLPWDYEEYEWDYASSAISAKVSASNEGVLWLYASDGTTQGDRNTRTVIMEGGSSIKGEFFIEAPQTGRWQISTYPAEAAEYFVVEPSEGEITKELTARHNGHVEFAVRASEKVPASQQVLHFNVSIYVNGQWRDANSEFNRKDWKLVRNP